MMYVALHQPTGWGEYMEDDNAHLRDSAGSGSIVDLEHMGRLLRGARIIAGFPGGDAFAAEIERATKIPMSKTILYNIETGQKEAPSFEEVLAILVVTQQSGGIGYLMPAIRPEFAEILKRLAGD